MHFGGFTNQNMLNVKNVKTINPRILVSFVPPSRFLGRAGILTCYPLPSAFAIGLGPPNPWLIASATETLDFRGLNFALRKWLLIPTFSLPYTPPALAGPASTQ